MLADAEDVEPHLVGQGSFLDQLARPLGVTRPAARRVQGQLAERVDTDFHPGP